jgi:hypothetical protein
LGAPFFLLHATNRQQSATKPPNLRIRWVSVDLSSLVLISGCLSGILCNHRGKPMLQDKFTRLNDTIITNKDLAIYSKITGLVLAATELADWEKGVDQSFNIGVHLIKAWNTCSCYNQSLIMKLHPLLRHRSNLCSRGSDQAYGKSSIGL